MSEPSSYEDGMDPSVRKQGFTVYVIYVPWKVWREKMLNKPIAERPFVEIGVDNTDGMIHIIRGFWGGQPLKTGSLTLDEHALHMEVFDWLIEWELVEWKSIGPEDRELFATDKLMGGE